jgi:integrase
MEELAVLLHPQELEILEELAAEFEELDEPTPDEKLRALADESEDAGAPKLAGAKSISAALLAINRSLRGRGPAWDSQSELHALKKANTSKKKAGQKKSKDKSKKERGALGPLDRERFEELGDELKEIEKSGRRLPAVPTREEMRLLLRTSKKKHQRDYVIIRLMYATGCRRSELENMRLADLNFKEQRIFVRDGKGDKDRYVLVDKKTAEILDDFTYGLALSDPIFDIEDRQINRRVQKWAEVAGLTERYEAQGRNFSSHCLRHAFATHLYEGGVDLYALRNLLGHRFLTTTKLYVHIGVGKILANYETSHPLASDGFESYDED